MIKKTIQAKKDVVIDTQVDRANLEKGDIKVMKFKDEKQYAALLGFDNFTEVPGKPPHIGMRKPISVVVDDPPQVDTDSLSADTDQLSEEFLCGICDRKFSTARGVILHRRLSHKPTTAENTATENAATEDAVIEDVVTENTATEDAVIEDAVIEDMVTENTATEKKCPQCQDGRMIVVSDFNIPDKGVTEVWECVICGHKNEERVPE